MLEILDAGRAYQRRPSPATIRYGGGRFRISAKMQPPQTILGAEQKAWFLERLQKSKATWKIWGNTIATLDMRADPQNLPPGLTKPWPGAGYAGFDASSGAGDHSTAYVERGEIYDFVRDHGITGFATVAGDRHSFWAGLAAKALPPKAIRAGGHRFRHGLDLGAREWWRRFEHGLPKDHPLRPLFVGQGPEDTRPQPTMNLLLRHGVQVVPGVCEEWRHPQGARLVESRSVAASFLRGHGWPRLCGRSRLEQMFETEFVCIPRPLERSERPDGGPLLYRTRHRASLWRKGETPRLEMQILEGDPRFSV